MEKNLLEEKLTEKINGSSLLYLDIEKIDKEIKKSFHKIYLLETLVKEHKKLESLVKNKKEIEEKWKNEWKDIMNIQGEIDKIENSQ